MAAYQYVEIRTLSTFSGSFSIGELAIRPTVSGTNIISGGILSASSTEGGSSVENIRDNNTTTYWRANGNIGPHKFRVGFTGSSAISQLDITTRNDSSYSLDIPTQFEIYGSNDANTWTLIRPVSRSVSQWTQGASHPFAVRDATAQYWRLLYLTANGGGYGQCNNLRMAATASGGNICFNGIATASSTLTGGVNSSSYVFGEEYKLFWVSNINTGQHWIQYKFSSSTALERYDFWTGPDGNGSARAPSSWRLECSTDTITWVSADEQSQTSWVNFDGYPFYMYGITAPSLPTTGLAHRYWRIRPTAIVSNSYWEVGEFEMRETATSTNVLSGGLAAANSYYDINGIPSKGNDGFTDGALGHYYLSNGEVPTWWFYDFGTVAPRNISCVTIYPTSVLSRCATSFSIDFSDDGIRWVTFTSCSVPAASWTSLTPKTFLSGSSVLVRRSRKPGLIG